MSRTAFRPIAAVLLVAAILSYVGCDRTYETRPGARTEASAPTPKDDKVTPARTTADPRPKPKDKDPLALFADWVKNPPAGILVISAEQDGHLQPCGCTSGQLGGLGRRYDMIEKMKAKGWSVAAIDLGNLIQDPAGSKGGPEQSKIKFDTALKALSSMSYQAVAVGPEDLKLGINETLGVLLNLKTPLFLAANVTAAEPFETTIKPMMIIGLGNVAVGVTAIVDPLEIQALADPDKSLLKVKTADETLPIVLDQMGKDTKVRVLMVQAGVEEAKRLAGKFPSFDLVISRSDFEDGDERAIPLNNGKTLLIQIGRKGKYAGVVGFFPGATPSVVYRRQPLDAVHFVEAETIRKMVDVEYQAVLKGQGVVENYTRTENNAFPVGATYVGAESCKTCHPKTFEKWASTKHARAFEALVDNPKRNREFDAECISCHTTGFTYKTGWVSAEKTPLLKGNQCENCHGPGSLHVAQPENKAFSSPMNLTAERADSSGFCVKCHDPDNDPHFEFAPRYAQIFHKGLDDPKANLAKGAAGAVAPVAK